MTGPRRLARPPVRQRVPRLAPLVAVALLWTGLLVHASQADDGAPPRPADARSAPLGSPPPAPAGTGGWSALLRDPDGGPVTWDPCRPVHWVLRVAGEPAGGRAAVLGAVAQVQAATGLHLVYDGTTDEAPSAGRRLVQRGRYGDRWAPVLVAWSTGAEFAPLRGAEVGDGVAAWADDHGRHLVTGQVVLDRDGLTDPGGRTSPLAATTALHELAHVVGLGHSREQGSVMQPVVTEGAALTDGDLRGLAAMGSGACRSR